MNKLDKKPDIDTNAALSGRKLFFNTTLLLLATMLIHSAVALYYTPWYRAVIMAGRKAPAIIELANEAVCDKVDTLRRQLAFMARQPVIRDLQHTDDVENTLLRLRHVIKRVTTLIEPFVGLAYGELRSQYHNLLYLAEFPRAYGLSILFDTGLFGSQDQFVELFATSNDYLATDEEMLSEVNVARNFIAWLEKLVDVTFSRITSIVAFYRHFSSSEAVDPVDTAGARNFMVAALTDFSDFRAIALKGLNGTIRTQAFTVSPEFLSLENADVRAITSNAAFYSGTVLAKHGEESPLWHIAVPIRNRNREPIACLSALVDLSFLSALGQISASQSDQKLAFVDSTGQFITGASNLATSQLRDEVVVAAMAADARGFFRLADSDRNGTFIAGKAVASHKYRFVPSWAVVVCGSLASYGASADRGILLAVFLLAALGCYALFYSIPGFFKFVVKERE